MAVTFSYPSFRPNTFLFHWIPECHGHPVHVLNFAVSLIRYPDYSTVLETLLSFNIPAKGMLLDASDELTAEMWMRLLSIGVDLITLDSLVEAVVGNMFAHVEILCQAVPGFLDKMHDDYTTRGSRNSVQLAVERGSPGMLQILLHYGAAIGHAAGYYRGATCLQLAVGAGNIGLVHSFLEKGVKVNEKRALINGRTAVEIAAEHGRLDVMKLLLLQREHLFQSAAERHQFIRAAKFAKIEGHEVIGWMLKQHIG